MKAQKTQSEHSRSAKLEKKKATIIKKTLEVTSNNIESDVTLMLILVITSKDARFCARSSAVTIS